MKTIVCDIDGVLCQNGSYEDYENAIPVEHNIEILNKLYRDKNQQIIIYTSRKTIDKNVTRRWLKKYHVKYHELLFNKPKADLYVDDKATKYFPAVTGNVKRKKLAIGMSGGMDSYLAYHYAIKEYKYKPSEIMLFYFDLGHPYAKKEIKVLKSLKLPVKIIHLDLIRKEFGNVPTEKKYIIPARNMIFATIMAGFAEKIWIVGMKYENHYLMYDKNDAFFNLSSIALTQAVGSKTIVESPFSALTKTDTLKWAKDKQIKGIEKTTSCYHATKLRCGVCSLCFKRYIAMKANGLSESYSSDPTKSYEAKRLIRAYKEALRKKDFTHYQKERILETFEVLGIK